MDRFQYVIVLALCVLVTLPLEFLFGARVWRRPRRLLAALAPALAVFVVWDVWATSSGTWDFEPRYTLGIALPGGMVLEELAFFAIIPICLLLTMEALRNLSAGTTPLQRRVGR